jgi:hypothetical protein
MFLKKISLATLAESADPPLSETEGLSESFLCKPNKSVSSMEKIPCALINPLGVNRDCPCHFFKNKPWDVIHREVFFRKDGKGNINR